jgi:hypothetical protein
VIQRQIEEQGVSTVSISLFRPFSEAVKPPRVLWVPFPFGRPLGAPNNRSVQQRVIRAALDLLSHSKGPVIEDFILSDDEAHLDARYQRIGTKCSPRGCNLDEALSTDGKASAPSPARIEPYDGDFNSLRAEISGLIEDYRSFIKDSTGRTQVRSTSAIHQAIENAAWALHRFVSRETIEAPSEVPDSSAGRQNNFVRLCADDIKAFYLEARLGRGGGDAEDVNSYNNWLWYETRAGRLIAAARDRMIETTDRTKDPNWMAARAMVPRGYGESGYTMVSNTRISE